MTDRWPDDDDLESLVGAVPPPPFDPALRQAILRRTTAMVRGRLRLGRLILGGSLVASYAAGLLTFASVEGWSRVATPAATAPAPAGDPGPPVVTLAEWKSLQAAGKLSEIHRRAGDRYLERKSDLGLALRSYARSLDLGSREDLRISRDNDNWLLMALKESREKEVLRAKADG